MIKIEINNIVRIKEEYFDGVAPLIRQRIDFYLMIFRVIDQQPGFDVNTVTNYPGVPTRTKTALIKILGRDATSFTKSEHYPRLLLNAHLSVHFYNERANYIHWLVSLIAPNALKGLVLADIGDLEAKHLEFTPAVLSPEGYPLMKAIICYDDFKDKQTVPFNAYDLVAMLNVNVCPYCNRIYTNTIITNDRKLIIRPPLDHFFSQAEHPMLGLCFYNLIPSCTYCNSNLKGSIAFNLNHHIHPYKEGVGGDATFDYLQVGFYPDKSDPRNYKILINENIQAISPKYLRIFGDDVNPEAGNVKVFKLREVYQCHTDIVGELVVKADRHGPYYAGSVLKLVAGLGASKREFYKYYFANYIDETDFNKRPLSKLTKDIVSKYIPEVL